MDWQDKRIHLYVSICQQYDQKHLWFYTERMSNNNTPTLSAWQLVETPPELLHILSHCKSSYRDVLDSVWVRVF